MSPVVFEAIGTRWQIDIWDDIQETAQADILQKIHTRIAEFDKHYSRFRDDSLVSTMAKQAGEYIMPNDAPPLLALYETMYRLTDGAMTPLIGQVLVEAGYDATYSLQSGEVHTPPRYDEVVSYHHPKLILKQPALLDFGAAGKGYLIDIVGDILKREGVSHFSIDAGGDILHSRTEPTLRVGLENPLDATQVIGVARLGRGSICGSSGNRRVWGKYHHIINPHTLASPKDILAVWAMADTALVADGLTTALFFTSPDILRQAYPFEYALLRSDGSLESSSGFPGEFFSA
jgi:thiamine biosynthesis lipoprotein